MSCPKCGIPRECLSTGTVRVNQFVKVDTITSFDNSGITIQGLNPSLLVSNTPIHDIAFSNGGVMAFIADRRVRVISVGEIHLTASSENSTVLVRKNGTDLIATVNSFTGTADTAVIQDINNANNILEVDDYIVLELNGNPLTDLEGSVITITVNEL